METPLLPIVLGSSSRWRQALLRQLIPDFITLSPDIDERSIRHPDPVQLVLLLARAKAEALLPRIEQPSLLITSDQVVICDGEVREKPTSPEQCRLFLRSYATAPAETITAVVVVNTATGVRAEGVDIARQYFHPIPEEVIDALVEQGQIFGCAGGFRIEDPLLRPYLLRRDGDEDSIRGLPLGLLRRLVGRM